MAHTMHIYNFRALGNVIRPESTKSCIVSSSTVVIEVSSLTFCNNSESNPPNNAKVCM